jgi:hypothetical protein
VKTFRDLKLTEEEASLVLSNPYRETEILGEKRGYLFWCLFTRAAGRGYIGTYEMIENIVTRATIIKAKR